MENYNELYHHGVKGMRWGVRRKKPRVSEDAARAQRIRKKSLSEMSNQELKDLNNRLNLERQYKDLTKKKSKGQKAVGAFIKTAGTIVAIEAAAKTYKRVGTAAMSKISNIAIDSIIK